MNSTLNKILGTDPVTAGDPANAGVRGEFRLNTFPLLILIVLFFSLLETTVLAAGDDETSSNSVPITFESFLTNPPAIMDAEFEVDQSLPPELRATHPNLDLNTTNPYILRLDGKNYILYQPAFGIYTGNFGGVGWRQVGQSPLQLADQKMNTPQVFSEIVGISKWPIYRFLNLGIEEIIPNTLNWAEGADSFTAKCLQDLSDEGNTNLGRINVQLHYVNGVPLTAITKDSWGRETTITYRYDPAFFDGILPVAFDVVAFQANNAPFTIFSLQIKKLQLSKQPIELNEFDPRIVLKGKYRGLIVWSNSLSYSVLKMGQMRPTLTAEEAQQRMTQVQAKKHPTGTGIIRTVLIATVLVPLIVILIKNFHQRNKKQKTDG